MSDQKHRVCSARPGQLDQKAREAPKGMLRKEGRLAAKRRKPQQARKVRRERPAIKDREAILTGGLPNPVGLQGAQSAQGVQRPTGPQSNQGPTGSQGPKGDIGAGLHGYNIVRLDVVGDSKSRTITVPCPAVIKFWEADTRLHGTMCLCRAICD